ncbi:uncharacterized protein [Drosophila pseudoobscura]|uniref:Uncharacterized protein n=1 Tax=Drosophila pseudoobscura pseudoobscura TaxID=46245 RepID=A0A6I8V3H8_DROPS|nr:uncharacterized protein LOC6897961 [Drosophila pseudoobscura]
MAPTGAKSKIKKRLSSESTTEQQKLAEVQTIIKKLDVSKQVILGRVYKNVPDACNAIWRRQYHCLDLQKLELKLRGSSLQTFIQKMFEDFRSAHFRSQQLQHEMNILDQAGIRELPSVKRCQITWGTAVQRRTTTFPQWPFYALPALMKNLRSLEIHSPLEVCFIEQFKMLEELRFHGEVETWVLKDILASDLPLKVLHFVGSHSPDLEGISQCKHMENLMVNQSVFLDNKEEIFRLPKLHILEIKKLTESKDTMKTLMDIIRQREDYLRIFRLNCSFINSAQELIPLELSRCRFMDGLELIDCNFGNLEMLDLGLPVTHKHAVFCHCPNLLNEHVLDFVLANAKLKQLVFIHCPFLTVELLQSVYKLRRRDKSSYPLKIKFKGSPDIWEAYKKNYRNFWSDRGNVLQVELFKTDYRPLQHVQFTFKTPPIARTE